MKPGFLSFNYFMLIAVILNSQIPGKNPFKNQNEPGSKIMYFNFQTMVEKLNDTLYIKKVFNASSRQLTSYISCRSLEPLIKNGLSFEKWDDGEVFEKGYYVDSKKVGYWLEEYEEGYYENGLKEGEWKSRNNAFGGYRIVKYKNGRKNGEVRNLDSLGNVVQVGIYENDSIISGYDGKIVDELPVFNGCDKLLSIAERKNCTKQKILEFLTKNLEFPGSARKKEIQGQAIVHFAISNDGKVYNYRVRRGLCDEIRGSIIKLMNLMPQWTPGRQEGKNVKVDYTLPLMFKLDLTIPN